MFKAPEILAQLFESFKSPDQVLRSEEEMIQELRRYDVKVVFFTGTVKVLGWSDLGEIKARNDYFGELKRKYPDVVLGAWVTLDPEWGRKGLRELDRCIRDLKLFGIAVCGALTGTPASDKVWHPYYELCVEAKVPIKIWVGHIAIKGRGIPLWTERPIPYVDEVACRFPDMTIICAHHPWPFHHEMASVLIHHPNVYNEQHGWSPKYFSPRFKSEINSRVQDKIMFGTDYPLFTYERMFKDWESEQYKPEVLEKVFYKNAQRVLGELGIVV